MPTRRPVAAMEVWLHIWAVPLLVLACAGRLLIGWLKAQQIWLSDMQLLVACLLLAVLLWCGILLGHRGASLAVSVVAGGAAWAAALTMISPGLWSGYSILRTDVALWLQIAAGALFLGGLIARWYLARCWLNQLGGHGYRWMLRWAQHRPLYARLLAQRVLVTLRFDFSAEE